MLGYRTLLWGVVHWIAVSKVSEGVWVVERAQVIVSGVVATDFIAVVGCYMVVAVGGSGHEMGQWSVQGVCRLTQQCVPSFARCWGQF